MTEDRRFVPCDISLLATFAAVCALSVGLFASAFVAYEGKIELLPALGILTMSAGFLWLWRERRVSTQRWAMRFGALGLIGWAVFLVVLGNEEPRGLVPVSFIMLANFAMLWILRVRWRRETTPPIQSAAGKLSSTPTPMDLLHGAQVERSTALSIPHQHRTLNRWPLLLLAGSFFTLYLIRPAACQGLVGCLLANGARGAVISVEAGVIALAVWAFRRRRGILLNSFAIFCALGVLLEVGFHTYRNYLLHELIGFQKTERIPINEQELTHNDCVFNPVSEVRQRYPRDTAYMDDSLILNNLSNPAKFRQTFPEYRTLDDDMIRRNMKRYLADGDLNLASLDARSCRSLDLRGLDVVMDAPPPSWLRAE